MVTLFARAARHATPGHIRHVAAVPPRAATGLVTQVYAQMEADFGMLAPPVALHAPAPEVLAASWLILRESLVASGLVSRAAKEAVAAAVSLANRCPYCVEVHGNALTGLTRGPDADAIVAGQIGAVADPRLRALAAWAHAAGVPAEQGRPELPFPPRHASEFIGVVVTFHYFNRMVNIFLRESPLPRVSGAARRVVWRVASRVVGRLASGHPPAGASLDLLPAAPVRADLGWACGQPHLAAAFARAGAAVDAAAQRSVPEPVRRLVLARLADGPAEPPGPGGRAWLDAAMAGLPEAHRPAGRLALLAAVASYRVTDSLVGDLRARGLDDRALIELASWASFSAARQIGTQLQRDMRNARKQ